MESAAERSERKRQREKQRRSDLASAFDVLANVLLQIEPGAEEKGTSRGGARHVHLNDSSEADHSDPGGGQNITRLDLIAETVEAIRRLHNENGKLKNALHARGGKAAVDEALQATDVNMSPVARSRAGNGSPQQSTSFPLTSSATEHVVSLKKLDQASYRQAVMNTRGFPYDSQFPVAGSASLMQQQGLSYEQMAHMALQQFSGISDFRERHTEKIDTTLGTSAPTRYDTADERKVQKHEMSVENTRKPD